MVTPARTVRPTLRSLRAAMDPVSRTELPRLKADGVGRGPLRGLLDQLRSRPETGTAEPIQVYKGHGEAPHPLDGSDGDPGAGGLQRWVRSGAAAGSPVSIYGTL